MANEMAGERLSHLADIASTLNRIVVTKKISEQDAKQGKQGLPVLYVLAVSLGLAVVVWGAVELYGELIAP
ncbi:hypothetical protein [Phyllobacterium zundukense]|uniref:hypothetical protein n=1 Tax=Phyllobacterium zundukense TaxID=1867719 RepID=UPI001055A021|nr:hypothetical protein [Phyllobacterium zundukense]